MSETIASLTQDVADTIHEITTETVQKLGLLWSELFEVDVLQSYLEKFPEHVQIFCQEVYDESVQKKSTLIQKIRDLEDEADTLRRQLKKEVHFDSIKGMPLLTASVTMSNNLQSLRDELKQRYEQIDEYLIDQEVFCEMLEEKPRELLKDPLPSEGELNEFKTHLDNLATEKTLRLEKIDQMRREIISMRRLLEEFTMSDRENHLLNSKNFPPTRTNMRALTDFYENTIERYEDLKVATDKTREKLKGLWQYLQTSPSIIKKFSKYTEYNQTNYDKLYNELDRCETIRRENIEKFIRKVREEIVLWWDKCLKSREERARFSTFNTNIYNEDSLDLHELELNDLKEFYERNEQVFKLINQRQEMWEKMKQLEEKANDPNRFKNRGGKLLEEERERKQIAIKLPKIEAELLELCTNYEQEHKRPFTIYGKTVEEVIKNDYQRREDEKAMISSARKKANLTASGKKINTTSRTPGSVQRNTTTSTSVLRSVSVQKSSTSIRSSAKKPVLSVAKAASSIKRKASPAKSGIHAKRSLLTELNSNTPEPLASSTFRKPVAPSASQVKPIRRLAAKVYDDHTATKRRSRTKSQRRSTNRRSFAKPIIQVNGPSDDDMHSESVTYEHFQNILEETPRETPHRSSLLPEARARLRSKFKSPKTPMSTSKLMSSSLLSRSGRTPSTTGKMTTKNLPILI